MRDSDGVFFLPFLSFANLDVSTETRLGCFFRFFCEIRCFCRKASFLSCNTFRSSSVISFLVLRLFVVSGILILGALSFLTDVSSASFLWNLLTLSRILGFSSSPASVLCTTLWKSTNSGSS